MTYNDWLIKITNTMQIRSTNYRLSQNDIILLTGNVFEEIATEVNLDFVQQDVLIDKDTDTYDINTLYTPVGNEIPSDVMSIQDEDGLDVSPYFNELSLNKYKANRYINEEKNYRFLEYYDGKNITFNRAVVPDIETLSNRLQMMLFPALLEGIMFYVQDAIPNPVGDGSAQQETNMYYQRYFQAKKNLLKVLPQRI